MNPDADDSRWFWPTVIVGTVGIGAVGWGLSRTDFAYLLWPIALAWALLIPLGFGLLLVRVGHPVVAALSVAVPLAILFVASAMFVHPAPLRLAANAVGIGFLLAFAGSDRLVAWWYRVVLFSTWRPPRP